MAIPSSVQTGQVSHPAARVVQGDACQGLLTPDEYNLIFQGNAAGIPAMKIFVGPISYLSTQMDLDLD